MAKIVLGIGASHTPLLTLTAEQWQHRAAVDYANQQLNMSDGRLLTYEQVLAELGPRCADVISPEILAAKEQACQDGLDRLADALAEAAPDIVLIVGDDQRELFGAANQPAIALFHGDAVVMNDKLGHDSSPDWVKQMGRGYLMDATHTVPGAGAFALGLIQHLMDAEFDVAACSEVKDAKSAGFGHAYGFIVKRLFRGRTIPIVPLLLNTYYGPNVPSAARCWKLGQALRHAIEASGGAQRVAVVASGGLSHFVVDEDLDRGVLDAMVRGDGAALSAIPRGALNSGSSEILNWVTAAGAAAHLPLRWHDYQPLFRTPAGTGVGAAFAIWGDGR
jgi:hypothetical protein